MQAVNGTIPIPVAADSLDIPERELARLLGAPPDEPLRGETAALARQAREWFIQYARPWATARYQGIACIEGERVALEEGTIFESAALSARLRKGEAHLAALAAMSAGPEAEEEVARLWAADRPDLAFVLDALASAAVERLATLAGAALCHWAEPRGMAVLPHYSPGYPGWDLREQSRLLAALRTMEDPPSRELKVLPSGMLIPRKSMLGLFGLTTARHLVQPLTDACPCSNCSYAPCAYRRAPYAASSRVDPDVERRLAMKAGQPVRATDAASAPRAMAPKAGSYAFPIRALERWSRHLLCIEQEPDGAALARFRFDGHICRSGESDEPLAFVYEVAVSSFDSGRLVRSAACRPAENCRGHEDMCAFMSDPDGLMDAIRRQRPFEGRPLDDVLAWNPPTNPAGCLCDAENRNHKWRIALQTIHYALTRNHEKDPS